MPSFTSPPNKLHNVKAIIMGSICQIFERASREGFGGFSMSLQIVTHQTDPVKSLSNCHRGCSWAGVPTILFNEFKTRAEPRRHDYSENSFGFVAVCIMVVFLSVLLPGRLSH